MTGILETLTKETIDIIYKEAKRKKNKKRIEFILKIFEDFIISRIQPFVFAIFGILIVLFLVNCFQFFYYIKLQMKISNILSVLSPSILTRVLEKLE